MKLKQVLLRRGDIGPACPSGIKSCGACPLLFAEHRFCVGGVQMVAAAIGFAPGDLCIASLLASGREPLQKMTAIKDD